MQELAGFSMKDCLSAPGLGWNYFSIMRDENDERIYTYNDKYMRHFERRSIKRGRVCAFNQNYISNNCGEFLKILSRETESEGNVYDIIEAYMNLKNNLLNYY